MLTLAIVASLALISQPTDVAVLQDQDQKVEQKEPRFNKYRRFQLKDLKVVELKLGKELKHKFKCWVMDTDLKRQEGMMFLQDIDVAKDQGMIFVFKKAEVQNFWMMNTFIQLDIAYIDAEGTIVKTYTMKPRDITTNYSSVKPAKFVLEVVGGTFKKQGIKAGQKVTIPKDLKAKN